MTAQIKMPRPKKKRRLTGLMLVGLFIIPFLLAWILFSQSDTFQFGTVNKGFLVNPPKDIGALNFALENNIPMTLRAFQGKWVILLLSDAICEETCLDGINAINQIRLALGKNTDKVRTLYLALPDTNNTPLVDMIKTQYPSTHVGTINRDEYDRFVKELPPELIPAKSGELYIIDPQSYLMMGYPVETDPMSILKDLKKVVQG